MPCASSAVAPRRSSARVHLNRRLGSAAAAVRGQGRRLPAVAPHRLVADGGRAVGRCRGTTLPAWMTAQPRRFCFPRAGQASLPALWRASVVTVSEHTSLPSGRH